LVFVTEDLTARFAESLGAPVIPCGCSQRSGAVRRSLRGLLAELETEHPRVKESLLSAMGNIEADRLLDPRYLGLEDSAQRADEPLRVLTDNF
jgi:tRNA 2-thiocytidine biosynthesis protein TtcA